MAIELFDSAKTELRSGITLIEASAGTGKTYTIAMLVLRFVVEHEIPIRNLLVVTFTKAATEELKDRIRLRLAEARRALAGQCDTVDPGVLAWLAGLTLKPDDIRQRLNLALLDIDQAGIFTIHGFCQRVLAEHTLESGQLFDAELLGDLSDLKLACADDFWRRLVYPRSAWEAAVLTAHYKTPEKLLASIDGIAAQANVVPDGRNLDEALATLKQAMETAKQALAAIINNLPERFADNKFKASYTDSFEMRLNALKDWLQGAAIVMPDCEAFDLLTANGLLNGLNGNQFRANKHQSAEQRKADFLAEFAIDTAPFDALAASINEIPLILRSSLLETLRRELDTQLKQQNLLSYDSLITRLSDVLQSAAAGPLLGELRQRYQAALIDEFQDTDDHQWTIFSRIFSAPGQYLYLIGDPKQAIYQFRGADIYAYLSAQQQAQHRFTLGRNWRSHPMLVDAVNRLFRRERVFLLEELAFNPARPALSADDGTLCKAGVPQPPMVLWQLPQSGGKTGYWRANSDEAAQAICIAVVNEIIDLLTGAYTVQPLGRIVRPKDLAILVRTNDQARDYQAILRAAGVPAVLNNTESVFATEEACNLYILLQALAQPGNSRLVKQALALEWFALDGQALYRLGNDETAFDAWMLRFAGYHQQWLEDGLIAMMRNLLATEKIEAALSRSQLAERQLTNLQHLLELMQQTAIDERLGVNKTLDWLRQAIVKAAQKRGTADDQQMRLESDADAIQIVTMHRSKGLEYPIVFCPLLWQRSSRLQSGKSLVKCHEQGRMIVDLGSDQFESRRTQAVTEELAEDLRILYVAVTRAKYRCYLAWADARSERAENDSALAWLLEFAGSDFSAQQKKLQAMQSQAEQAFAYRLLELPGEIARTYRKPGTTAALSAKQRNRHLFTSWQMSSYTALSALAVPETPELPEDRAGEQHEAYPDDQDAILPKGAATGNAIHELLELTSFTDLAESCDISSLRDKVCRRYGVRPGRPDVIDALLRAVVSTPLSVTDPAFTLMNVDERRCLKEMPFYLLLQPLDASRINRILQDAPACQPLTGKALSGYLTGFIDLVCEYGGRFYVMDYKTNSLPDYGDDSLVQAMREHNYGLQYWIYTVVVHLYLQQRLPDYDYERHFGGVRYLFVRGMRPDLPMSGVYQDRPDLQRIESLAKLFGGNI